MLIRTLSVAALLASHGSCDPGLSASPISLGDIFGGDDTSDPADDTSDPADDTSDPTPAPITAEEGDCHIIQAVSCGDVITANSATNPAAGNSITDYGPVVGNWSGPELGFRFAPASAGEVTVRIEEPYASVADFDLFVLERDHGACDPYDLVANGWTSSTFDVNGGTEYTIFVDGYMGTAGEFTISVTCDMATSTDPVEPPPEDDGECGPDTTCVNSFPFSDSNTTAGSGHTNLDSYSCSPGSDESGPEHLYRVTLPTQGFLSATLDHTDPGVDVDLHVLSSDDASTCWDRGDTKAGALLEAGTWYVVADTYGGGSGGGYEVTLGFTGVDALSSHGLPTATFERALTAFDNAWQDDETDRLEYTVVDFSQSSANERLWTVDLRDGSVLWNMHVAHGSNSTTPGHPAMASRFSNVNGSHKSSLGLARAAETYHGTHGYSMRLDGLDPGYNDRIRARAIVMHGSTYARPEFAASHGYLGRSWGCLAMDDRQVSNVIDDIKNGGLIFSWYPDGNWSNNSPWLH